MKSVRFFFVAVLMLPLGYLFPQTLLAQNSQAGSHRPTVLVLGVQVLDNSIQGLQAPISESLWNITNRDTFHLTLDFTTAIHTLREKGYNPQPDASVKEASRMGKAVNADWVLLGSTEGEGAKRTLKLTLVNVDNRKVIGETAQPYDGTIGDLVTTLMQKAVNKVFATVETVQANKS